MKTSDNPVIICLTPVKNEAWIIERFLQCASLWADHIILADQNSTDNTLVIASKFSKVKIITNPALSFNETLGRSLLIDEARKIKGKRIMVALDADECFTSNILNDNFWSEIALLKIGTTVSFNMINIHPDFSCGWQVRRFHRLFIDDNKTPFSTKSLIHMRLLPVPEESIEIVNENVAILHYQYTDWNRMKSKHRWYQAWETLNFPEKNPIGLYRMYHHMYAVSKQQLLPLENEWFKGYVDAGIDMFSVKKEEYYYWDDVVMEYFEEYGINRFSKIAIWDNKWGKYKDPRSIWIKILHCYLRKSQPMCKNILVKILDSILRKIL